MEPDCLFCRIVAHEVPSDIVCETDATVAFRDLDPQAPTHVLVVPKQHHSDLAALVRSDPALLGAIGQTVAQVASTEGVEDGYRTVFNTGAGAGQTVFHCHAHVLGGRRLTWPPG